MTDFYTQAAEIFAASYNTQDVDLIAYRNEIAKYPRNKIPKIIERVHKLYFVMPTIDELRVVADGLSDNKFDALATSWRRESSELGIMPGDTTPPHVHERRMRQFWEVFDNVD